jgi:hypothetical protein
MNLSFVSPPPAHRQDLFIELRDLGVEMPARIG